MKTTIRSIAVAFAAAVALTGTAMADNVLLKMPFAFNPKLPNVTSIAKIFNENVPMVRDDLKVKIYAPGKLVPPFEILDAVSTGKVNSGLAVSAYWTGKIPSAPIFAAVPFGPEVGEMLAWYKNGNGATLHQEMYDEAGYNVRAMACGILAPATAGWFQKEINSMDDFQGLQMRSIGLGAMVLQKVGASTSSIPVGEIYPALEKGAIDAVELSGPAVDSMIGLPKVAKYNYFPGWQKQSLFFELLINKDVWDGMNDGQRAAIEMACDQSIANSIAEGEAIQFGPMAAFADTGVEVRQLPTEVLAGLHTAWEEVAADLSAKDPMFKKVYEDLAAYRASYKIWGSNAFLPRD
jgi:TRAP-type mannitol/chloroaromatic compound transport system substrate-binding protein